MKANISNNVVWFHSGVSRHNREELNGHKGVAALVLRLFWLWQAHAGTYAERVAVPFENLYLYV